MGNIIWRFFFSEIKSYRKQLLILKQTSSITHLAPLTKERAARKDESVFLLRSAQLSKAPDRSRWAPGSLPSPLRLGGRSMHEDHALSTCAETTAHRAWLHAQAQSVKA